MNFGLLLFFRLICRPILREPIRMSLTVLSVALGVGVVVAIDLAGDAAAGSFRASLESVTGKYDLVLATPGGIDESLLGQLVQLPYPLEFSPRIEAFAIVNGKGETYPFIGLDLIAHANIAPQGGHSTDLTQKLSCSPIWVGKALGLKEGEQINLLINDVLQPFTVAGVLPSRGAMGGSNVIVADIGLAQSVTGKIGKIDRIDVTVPAGQPIEHWRNLLKVHLPEAVTVEPQGSRTEENRKMLSAFRWNLHVLSYIALLVGGFLIYNTISISVVRRRSEIGVVRALGGTRLMIAAGFLLEAAAYAVVGTGIGLILGRVMAIVAVRLIGSTVQSLYVSSDPAPLHFTLTALLAGSVLGLGVSLLAALAPAVEASRVAPTEAMARGREQYVATLRSRVSIFWVIGLILGGVVLTQLGPIYGKPVFAYIAVLLFVSGTSVAIPALVGVSLGSVQGLVTAIFGPEALLAGRSLRASLARTSVLTAALATAVAMTASIGIMVGSFRQTVSVWMNNQLKADFYLRPAGGSSADRYPTMSAQVADQVEKVPGVSAVDRVRVYPITYEGLPANFAGGQTSSVRASESTPFLPGENRDEILKTLPTGDFAIVSEPFANKHGVHPGITLTIPLNGVGGKFKVLGIYYDYSTERGYVIVARRTLLKYLPDQRISNLAVYLNAGADGDSVRSRIDQVISGRSILVFSNRILRRAAIDVFDRTFRIAYALEAVAVFVAVIGIAGALLAMVIDRRRELGVLRFLGADKRQIRKLIVCEAGLLGLLSNAIGLVLGTVISLVLIFVINKQSFGWTIQFHWPVAFLLSALTGIYFAIVISALYPARSAIRLNPIEVVHEG